MFMWLAIVMSANRSQPFVTGAKAISQGPPTAPRAGTLLVLLRSSVRSLQRNDDCLENGFLFRPGAGLGPNN